MLGIEPVPRNRHFVCQVKIWYRNKIYDAYPIFHVQLSHKLFHTMLRWDEVYLVWTFFGGNLTIWWRRQWQPTPVLLPGKSHGRRSLVGCSSWDRWVRHDWATSLSLFTFMHWRRKWQPTPVFLPGESQWRGAWWAAVYGVTQSRTRLKRLSSSSNNMEQNVLTIGQKQFYF